MAKITEEIRQRLEENGIPEITYQHRIYRGDDAYEASTRPVRKQSMTPEIKANLEKNNIKYITYWQRVQHGMSPKEASTKAVHTSTKLTDEQRSIMKKNGIKPSTVSKRIARGWTVEKAIGQDGEK
jgi:hypothetical protein